MARIEHLTLEQEQKLHAFHREWLDYGLSCDPADRPRAEAAISEIYGMIGEMPPTFIWCDSPMTAILRGSLSPSLGANLRASLGGNLGADLRDSLQDSLGASLGDSLRASLRASLWDSLGSAYYGQHDAYWVAYYRYPEAVLGVQYDAVPSRQLHLWSEISQSAGWWWPYEGVCIITERPEIVRMEPSVSGTNRLRLHADNGPAVRFRDGWSIWAIHGVRVSQQVVEAPQTLTIEQINTERNTEVRRIMLDRYGWERYVTESHATTLDRDLDNQGQSRELLRVEIPGDEPYIGIKLTDSTPLPSGERKSYLERVPPTMRTCAEAVAWQMGVPVGVVPLVET